MSGRGKQSAAWILYWYFYLRIGSPAEDLAYRSRSLCHWPHVSATRRRRWPGGCYCTTMWWAGGEEDACSVQKPLDGSDPCLKKESKLISGLLFLCEFLSHGHTFIFLPQYNLKHIKILLGTGRQGYLVGFNVQTAFKSITSPKNSACNSKGKCMVQSSLTPWSTTISVMKMTAILHL